jgi:dTDP-glucose pyrophosphorylase
LDRIVNVDAYVCFESDTVRDAMSRLNALPADRQFQIVVDEARRVRGTITDGDLRRAILKGVSLEAPVAACMNDKPILGRAGAAAENAAALRKVVARVAFLPVVDEEGRLQEVLAVSHASPIFTALVMAGGFGKRLGEKTRTTPKPLISIGDKPILEHLLRRLESANASEVFVSTHYLAPQIETFIARRKNAVPVRILHEPEPLGTAGAVGLLPGALRQPFMVLNADVLTSVDLAALLEFHARHLFDATIAVAQHQVKIPYGVVRHNAEGHFLGVEEKPTLSHFVAAGIYLLAPEFRTLVANRERIDMPELMERGRAAGLKIGLFPIHEYWTDVGRPQDLERAISEFSSGKLSPDERQLS